MAQSRRPVNYEMQIVTFVDILGFRELVESKKAGDISRIIRIVKEAVQPWSARPRAKKALKGIPDEFFFSFSDTSIILIPLRKRSRPPTGTLHAQLMHMVYAQAILIYDEGIVIRGGMSVGSATTSYRQPFGPAVVKAYEIESKVAMFPRIVVDKEVFNELRENQGLWIHDQEDEVRAVRDLLREGDDGQLFIDYLRVILEETEDPDDYAARHQALIVERLEQYKTKPAIRAKYEWMEHYHRAVLDSWKRNGPPGYPEFVPPLHSR